MSDEFDEAAEIAKLRYSIRVLIVHPTLRPDEISDALNLNPDISHWVGQPRRTPKGETTGGVWPDTRWSVTEIRNGERFFFKRLDKLLDRFSKHRDFLRRVAETGGETIFIIGLCGEANIGSELTEQAVAKLADLKGSLGVEVFPRMNQREEEYIWADDP